MLPPETWDVLRLWRMLETHGVLPEAGGVLDQSAWLVAALEEIERALAAERAAMKPGAAHDAG